MPGIAIGAFICLALSEELIFYNYALLLVIQIIVNRKKYLAFIIIAAKLVSVQFFRAQNSVRCSYCHTPVCNASPFAGALAYWYLCL